MQQDRSRRRQGSPGAPSLALPLVLAILASFIAGCAPRPLVPFGERFDTPSTVRLKVLVEDGAVTVTEGPAGAVLVSGEHPLDVHDYAGSVAAGEARIELKRRRSFEARIGQRGAHMEVQVPAGSTVDIEGSNGAVRVTGAFEVSRVKASNGPVEVDGARGALTADTSNGGVTVADHNGALVARSNNGPIQVTNQRGGAVQLITSNGAVRFEGAIEAGSDNTLETSNGPIEVVVTGTPAFTLDATTSNGGVTSRFALLEGTKSDSKLTGRVGDGQARLTLRTSNGPIEVR
ncbi:MAG: DUF4097 family beta strand repeat protein [Dehalococcoidia bacterium]|nr:DUF4097 family beta strand repeat protein [Dehalococcoidia bacterium]